MSSLSSSASHNKNALAFTTCIGLSRRAIRSPSSSIRPLSNTRRTTTTITRAVAHDATSIASAPSSSDGDATSTMTQHHNSEPVVTTSFDPSSTTISPTLTPSDSTTNTNNNNNSNNNHYQISNDVTTPMPFTVDEISELVDVVEQCDLSDFRFKQNGFSIEISRPGGLGFDSEGHLNPQPEPLAISSPSDQIDDLSYVEDLQSPSFDAEVEEEIEHHDSATENEIAAANGEDVERKDPDQIYESDFVVTSNRVGFFFCGAKNKPPLVNVGDSVAYNQPVCIIEQLGQQYVYLSEAAGKVVKVFVEDGDAVEYGTQIMVIRPD